MRNTGYVTQTDQIVACDFRKGNQSPNSKNLAFIKQYQAALPEGCIVKHLRIDAAGYQIAIIEYCDKEGIDYAIRAVMSLAIKEQIEAVHESDWQPMLDKKGEEIKGQETLLLLHWIGDYDKPLVLVIQRKRLKGQGNLILRNQEIIGKEHIYRAIATNREVMSDSGTDPLVQPAWRRQREQYQRIKTRSLRRHTAML